MQNLFKNFNLLEVLLSLATVSLIAMRASGPLAVTIVVIGALQALNQYLTSKPKIEDTTALKDKLVAIESKIAMMSLRK